MPDAAWFRVVYLVSRREFITRVRSRFFLISTGLLVLGICGYILLQANVFNRAGETSFKVGFTPATHGLAAPLKTAAGLLGFKVEESFPATDSAGQAEVQSADLDALVGGDPLSPTLTVKNQADPQLTAALGAVTRQAAQDQALAAQGVSPSALAAEVARATVHVRTLSPGEPRGPRDVTGVIVAILLFVSLQIYGQLVAAGVVEEKSNRIIEILLSTLRSRQLLLGKVAGIGAMGLLQLVVVGAAGLLMAQRTNVISVPTVGAAAVGGGVLWFVLGFLFFALLYAAAAALVSRQEDLGAVTTPLSMVLLGVYLTFYWVIANPTSTGAAVLSMIPPFAPVLMPARMAAGDAAAWQVLVAVALTLAATFAVSSVGARIYTNSVLRIGARVSLREAWAGRP